MRQQVNAGLGDWVSRKLAENGRRPVSSPAPRSKPWWRRGWEKLTNSLVALGQSNPLARQTLLNLSNGWFRYVQPTVNATADFISGFTTQTIQNNLDALVMVTPMPPSVRQNYYSGWESLHSGRSVWYQAGRFVGSLAGIAQGVWEMGSGIATATGGTVVSCGTVVLCFSGGGAAVVAGTAVAAHGVLVTSAGIINAIQSGQALFASAKSAATSNNARKLERDIEQATGQTKPAGYETHHIVPSGSNYKSAVEARKILERFGIDINDAGNGVFLPKHIHDGLANNHRYMNAVFEDLQKATSKDEAIEILQRMGQQLLDGIYPR